MDYQEIISRLRENNVQDNCHDCALGYVALKAAEAIERLIDQIPVSAHWICRYDRERGETEVICSHCGDRRNINGCYVSTTGESIYDEDAFCPQCGAAMDEGRNKALSNCQIIRNAEFISVWDDGHSVITSKCSVNMETKEVFDIEACDSPEIEKLDILDCEYIMIPGSDQKFPVSHKDALDVEEDYHGFWYK